MDWTPLYMDTDVLLPGSSSRLKWHNKCDVKLQQSESKDLQGSVYGCPIPLVLHVFGHVFSMKYVFLIWYQNYILLTCHLQKPFMSTDLLLLVLKYRFNIWQRWGMPMWFIQWSYYLKIEKKTEQLNLSHQKMLKARKTPSSIRTNYNIQCFYVHRQVTVYWLTYGNAQYGSWGVLQWRSLFHTPCRN